MFKKFLAILFPAILLTLRRFVKDFFTEIEKAHKIRLLICLVFMGFCRLVILSAILVPCSKK
jgi:hypothetical protein